MASKIRKILIVVCALVILACAAWKVILIIEEKKQQQKENSISDTLKPGASFFDFLIPSAFADEEIIELPPVSEDFNALLSVNSQSVGWLTAGERIDGPVVQADNKYYLTHDLFGEEDSNGTIFLNEANTIYPRDQILLIHAHFMKNKGMFGTLPDFLDWSYVQQYPIVTFRTIYDSEDVYYVPIAAFHASMDEEQGTDYFDLLRINFDKEEEFASYLRSISRRSEWKTPIKTTTEDMLIALVTCSYTLHEGRLILVFRQLHADETIESITEQIRAYTQE